MPVSRVQEGCEVTCPLAFLVLFFACCCNPRAAQAGALQLQCQYKRQTWDPVQKQGLACRAGLVMRSCLMTSLTIGMRRPT